MHQALSQLLEDLERELKAAQLWSSTTPSLKDLQSEQPFCVDTLRFEQWLQFVMLPRFRYLVDTNSSLPRVCDITSMAEEAFKDHPELACLKTLKAIDELLSLSTQ